MANYICPCCGQRFNGRKCQNCYYETFNDEIERTLHTHQPANTRDVQIPRPAQVQREWEQQKREFRQKQQRKRSRRSFPKWLVWVLVISLLEPAFLIAGEVVDAVLGEFPAAFISMPEPEPDVAIPEDAAQVFSADGLTVYIRASEDELYYHLFLENATDRDVRLTSRAVIVDGFLSELSSAYCSALAGATRSGDLWLDGEDMVYATMDIPHRITVDFSIYDTKSHEDIVAGSFTIDSAEPVQPLPPPAGDVLADTESVQIRSLGYAPSDFSPERFDEGYFPVYLENKTQDELTIYSEQVLLNGEETDAGVWCQLPPQTRTVTRLWFYSAEALDIETLADVETLEIQFLTWAPQYDETQVLDMVSIPLP